MDGFVNFMVDNYLIFLLVSLILIFALIGYLVDMKKKDSTISEVKKETVSSEEEVLANLTENMPTVSLNEALGDNKENLVSETVESPLDVIPTIPVETNEESAPVIDVEPQPTEIKIEETPIDAPVFEITEEKKDDSVEVL